jgi:hypothetical protein
LSLSEYTQAAVDEWTHFVAAQAIHINGVRAFNEGDAVPTSHVTRGVVAASEVRRIDETLEQRVALIASAPVGTYALPAPEDAAAAAAANSEAGVE